MKNFDIFISYRRDGGRQYARILQLMLSQRGYRVFLDYDELKDGLFNNKIKEAIIEAPIFMLVLSKDSMERCADEKDRLREEILLAVQEKKCFVPVNPDKMFDGIRANVPEEIKLVALETQYSEIDFGQALGVTLDLMIKDRLEPKLGIREKQKHQDNDIESAKITLKKNDITSKYIKGLYIVCIIAIVSLIVGFGVRFNQIRLEKERLELENKREILQQNHKSFNLYLSPDLTISQINTIDWILKNMVPIRPDTLWMSKYEFTVGQWYGILGKTYDESLKDIPMTDVSYGEIYMKIIVKLRAVTNIEFDLPTIEEWQYAAHGGKYKEKTRYAGSDEALKVAWYKDNSGGRVHRSNESTGLMPNFLDLFDMSGNVAEWCNSPFYKDSSLWTVCGGNYNSSVSEVTSDSFIGVDPNTKNKSIGFRLIIRKR